MKKLYLFAALAAMLAACSENDLTAEKQVVQQNAEEGAVDFDVYVGRGLTRGGLNGPITTNSIESGDHSTAGFGVFGYYTDGEPYSAITKPNFFYNQQVTYDVDKWTYDPVKYWPNEFGGDAKSDQVDRVTLFAYLPWVEVDPLTGVTKKPTDAEISALGSDDAAIAALKNAKDPTTNITGMTRNTATGDPFIKYVSTMAPTNSVDLCYGVAAATFTSSNSAVNQNNIEKGKPYIDVVKPGTDANSKIKFDFKHATAQMRVTIDAHVNDQTNGKPATTVQTDYTRIWVRSVTFTGITHKGSLCLNSTADSPEWYDINGSGKITSGSLTVFDGRKDGKEANDVASNETPATLNPVIIQSKPYSLDKTDNNKIKQGDEQPKIGVTQNTVNLFDGTCSGSDIQPVFVIPTKEKMRVTIVYDVETVDPNLPYYLSDGNTPGSTIQNTIYKDIETFGEIKAGYCYTLNLHLGMRTVDFDAEVTPWQYYGADVDLPSNMQTFAASYPAPDPKPTLTLPAGQNSYTYQFAVSGLDVNKSVNVTSAFGTGATATPVNGAGISIVTIPSIAKNTKVENIPGDITVSDGSNTVTIAATQQAAPLGMSIKSVSAPKTVTLTKTTTTNWDEAVPTVGDDEGKKRVKIWRNGMLMEVKGSSDTNAANQVKFVRPSSGNDATLTFHTDLQPGDIVTVSITAVDAAEESVTANMGGVVYPAPATKALTYRKADFKYDAYLPTYYGPGSATYSWNSEDENVAALDSDGKIAAKKYGEDITITATLSTPSDEDAKALGWYYLTKSDTYELTVNRQETVGTFTDPSSPISDAYTSNKDIKDLSELFTFTGKEDTSESADGEITYTIVSVIKSAGDPDIKNKFEIASDKKTLKVTSSGGDIAAGDYTVTVTASMADGDKYAGTTVSNKSFLITSTTTP